MEKRYAELDRVRQIFERCMLTWTGALLWPYWKPAQLNQEHAVRGPCCGEDGRHTLSHPDIVVHQKVKVWLKYCRFEEDVGDIGPHARLYGDPASVCR